MKHTLLALAAALAIGLLAGRCSSPRPGLPSADSTRIANAARQIDTVLQTVTGTLVRTDTVIRWVQRRSPPVVPPRPDSVDPRTDSLYARIAYDSTTIAVLTGALVSVRDTLASIRERLVSVPAVLDHGAQVIGKLERRRSYPWSAGILLEAGRPVGGFIERRVWRLTVGAEASDGPNEPATLRVKAGLTF